MEKASVHLRAGSSFSRFTLYFARLTDKPSCRARFASARSILFLCVFLYTYTVSAYDGVLKFGSAVKCRLKVFFTVSS